METIKNTELGDSLLKKISSPEILRTLFPTELPIIAKEIRELLISSLDQCGGHLGASLGVVELTIALHYIFNTPTDFLVWDVGHQAYPHKILTGRQGRLHTIKQLQGLAPFPSRDESPFDAFGTGHSSTSISAALGLLLSQKDKPHRPDAIAVIGDGALTGGIAFEALNHAGSLDTDLIVILNDNDMSISKNVGALTHYFGRILSSKIYSSLKEGGQRILANKPVLTRWVERTKRHVKGMIVPGAIFEELGFHYTGPIDGHNLTDLTSTLREIKKRKGPRLLHVITTKGKGYHPAEKNPEQYHAVSAGFHSNTSKKFNLPHMKYSQVFGEWLCATAEHDTRLIAITPAMCQGSGMENFSVNYKDRFYDVGIAEQHAVTLAAGMACGGNKPVVAIYSTFLQRAYDQVIHDVALQNLDVTFAIDRAGLVGPDGPTHSGNFDLSFLRCIPNLVIMAPADENECYQMLKTAYQYKGPAAVRYPRGYQTENFKLIKNTSTLPIGQAKLLRKGKNIALLAFGRMVKTALMVGNKLDATVYNMRFIKPLDIRTLQDVAKTHRLIVTIEENTTQGGAGSAINEFLLQAKNAPFLLNLGLPDQFISHGTVAKLLAQCKLDVNGISNAINKKLKELS